LGGVVALAAGADHTCALRADGSIYCWGGNTTGQSGTAAGTTPVTTPAQVNGLGGPAIAITAGAMHTCALGVAASGTQVACWGYNGNGQLGNGTTTDSASPVVSLTGVRSISAGGNHTCAVLADGGGVECWGDNGQGETGDGTSGKSLSKGPNA